MSTRETPAATYPLLIVALCAILFACAKPDH